MQNETYKQNKLKKIFFTQFIFRKVTKLIVANCRFCNYIIIRNKVEMEVLLYPKIKRIGVIDITAY